MYDVIEHFKNELNNMISCETNPLHFHFFAMNYGKEHFTDEDLIEIRGYYKGLKVARECLEKHIAISEEIKE